MKGKGFDPLLSGHEPGVFPLHQPLVMLARTLYWLNIDNICRGPTSQA